MFPLWRHRHTFCCSNAPTSSSSVYYFCIDVSLDRWGQIFSKVFGYTFIHKWHEAKMEPDESTLASANGRFLFIDRGQARAQHLQNSIVFMHTLPVSVVHYRYCSRIPIVWKVMAYIIHWGHHPNLFPCENGNNFAYIVNYDIYEYDRRIYSYMSCWYTEYGYIEWCQIRSSPCIYIQFSIHFKRLSSFLKLQRKKSNRNILFAERCTSLPITYDMFDHFVAEAM